MNKFFYVGTLLTGILLISGCNNDDDDTAETKNLTLNISGLEDLGSDYAYEGWIMVDGSPVSTGTFTVDGTGALSETTFDVNATDLESATAFILSIEPNPDNDPNPSDTKLLGGAFSGDSATITVDHMAALGDDFTSSTGTYILATPTDGNEDMNELSGVWFLDNSSGSAVAGLSLPTLPVGWKYEGWAVMNDTAVSTGTFTSTSGNDENAPFSGTAASAPMYPGEDFLMNAPVGLTFPTDLSGSTMVISVEPNPDNSLAPFLLKPLVGMVPNSAMDHVAYMMSNNATSTNPTGMASR